MRVCVRERDEVRQIIFSYWKTIMLCNYPQRSFFRDVFDPIKDFGNYKHIIEIPESMQLTIDPVGYYYFHKVVVYNLLYSIQLLNNRRYNLRDVLREMDRIWRYNSMQRIVLNEPDYRKHNLVAKRVNELIRVTRQKFHLDTRVENLVTGETIKNWEYQIPELYPAAPLEKQERTLEMRIPHIDKKITTAPFQHVNSMDKRVFIPHRQGIVR